jgi:predicted O-linked N-acetylglucosamine transferase (SPINDLY family)
VKKRRGAPARQSSDGPWAAALEAAKQALARNDFDTAGRQFERALRLTPRHPDLLTNLGAVRARQHRHDEAIAALEQALEAEPANRQARGNLVITLSARGSQRLAAGQLAEGVEDLRRALTLDPQAGGVESTLGLGLAELGRTDEAIAHYRRALERSPGDIPTLNRLALALMGLGRFDEARAQLEQAASARPDVLETAVNLSALHAEVGRMAEAAAWGRRAVALNEQVPQAHNNLGLALREQGEVAGALAHFERACALAPLNFVSQSNRLLTLNYLPGIEAAPLAAAHREVGAAWVASVGGRLRLAAREPDPDRPLRIGYVSPDLRTHSVGYFFESFVGEHDPAAVEVTCYSNTVAPDEVTARLRALAHRWREIATMNDVSCTALIERDGIDVLVDLAGHTARTRLAVFARRAAPIQMSYLGYGVTTGLPTMDYLLTDDLVDPLEASTDGTETVLHLPGGYLSYRPPFGAAGGPELQPLPARRNGHVTFGSFNNLAKLSDPALQLWAELLKRLPTARLLLKARGLAAPEVRARVEARFSAQGVSPERIELAPPTAGTAEHLALYGRVDVALDTFPYNGTTTTCEALWMGVPVITLSGSTHMGRVGHSVLARVGAADLVAPDHDQYLKLATTLAGDLGRLETLRRELRPRLLASPLTDGRRLARALESAYRLAWRRSLKRA